MCEEGAAKLRLKPRTAPSARGRERSPGSEPPPRPQIRLTGAQKYFLCFPALEFGRTEGSERLGLCSSPASQPCPFHHGCERASTNRCSWFEKEELNEREKTWLLLLKDISQDSHCTNWDTVPSFPEFLEKKQEEKSPEHQEVFTVGKKDFQWVSFPSFHKEKCLNPKDLSSQQPTQSQSNELHKGQGQADKLKSLSSTAEKTCRGISTDQAKTAAEADTKGVSELEGSPKARNLPGHSSSALGQSPAGALSPQQHHTGTAQSSRADSKEKGEEKLQIQTHQGDLPVGEKPRIQTHQGDLPVGEKPRIQTHQGDLLVGEKPRIQTHQGDLPVGEKPRIQTHQGDLLVGEKPRIQTHQGDLPVGEAMGEPAEKPRLGSAPGAESHKEKMENKSEAASALDSCPMCLMQFSGRLSQLDIDGHLARCLSESADDVMW